MLASAVGSITLRCIFALASAWLITVVLGPWVIRNLKQKEIGQQIREEGVKEHLKKSGIPTMGGIMIIVAVSVATLICARIQTNVILVLASLLWMGVLGFLDDFLKITRRNSGGLVARQKLVGQILFGAATGWFLYQAPWMDTTLFIPVLNARIELGLLYPVLVILTITGSSNAVNLTDGLDGLAAGVMFIVIGCIGMVAYFAGNVIYSSHLGIPMIPGAGELAVFSFAMVGACLGFLWFNASPAQVFMGDTGSLALGGALGTVALLCKAEIFLVFVGAIFVLECISVILQVASFKTTGRRIFRMAPIHHHFELMGWSENKVVIRFWIITLILAVMGMSLLGVNGRIFSMDQQDPAYRTDLPWFKNPTNS